MKQAKFNFRRREQCTHAENLGRVHSKIATAIAWFFRRRRPGSKFYLSALTAHVWSIAPAVAPDTPRRVLCEMRQAGTLDYECLSRRDSLYRITKTPEPSGT